MRRPLADRFWEKVRRGPGCWEWQGGTSPEGYGRMRIVNPRTKERFLVLPHRVSYMLHVGDVPLGTGYHGTCVCHRCDNPRCVRPSHLYLGTQQDNVWDAIQKGHHTPPEPLRKLTFAKAMAVRRRYARGDTSQRALARRYGVDRTTVRDILAWTTWKRPVR